MNEREARKLFEQEQGYPIRSRIFRDKRDDTYHTQIDIMDIKYMEEVEWGKE
jgi:hypothetical protein